MPLHAAATCGAGDSGIVLRDVMLLLVVVVGHKSEYEIRYRSLEPSLHEILADGFGTLTEGADDESCRGGTEVTDGDRSSQSCLFALLTL